MERRRPFPGWYVAAVPGAEFQVCVTSIQSSFPTVLGKKLGKDRAVFADLLVDGSMADGCRTDRSRMLREVYIDGFLESLTVPRASGSIISSIRKFVFEKVDGTRMENATGEDRGAIVLYMFSAKHAAVGKKASLMSIDPSSEDADVFKKGRTFKVARTGKQIAKTYYRRASFLRDKKLEGTVSVFLREKSWLESRRIVDANGDAWAPAPTVDLVADITEKRTEEDVGEGPSTTKRKSQVENP